MKKNFKLISAFVMMIAFILFPPSASASGENGCIECHSKVDYGDPGGLFVVGAKDVVAAVGLRKERLAGLASFSFSRKPTYNKIIGAGSGDDAHNFKYKDRPVWA